MKITRIRVTNYRGIESLDQQVPEHGMLATGGNSRGKTSLLRAVRAALDGQDVSPDAIRTGADRSEILVDLDDLSIRRAISKAGNTLAVTNGEGFKMTEPQTRLRELLGTAALDPLDLFLAKPAERRDKILAAMPVRVTREQLDEWAPGLPSDFSTEGHGLQVLERAHEHFYDLRTAANKATAEKGAAVKRAESALGSQREGAADPGVSVPDAEQNLQQAIAKYTALNARKEQAAQSQVQAEGARARISELRRQAEAMEAEGRVEVDLAPLLEASKTANDAYDGCAARIAEAEARLAALREEQAQHRRRITAAEEALDEANGRLAEAAKKATQAASVRQQADEQEATVNAMVATPPTDAEMDAAMEAGRNARTTLQQATAALEARKAEEALAVLKAEWQTAAKEALALDQIVRRLAKDAPAKALESAEAIPGLSVEGDAVFLDGVKIEAKSSSEQMRFAVDIAKRLNARSKILVVDGLERLDVDQREEFVREATADGWQLLGTLVTGGDLVFGAIEVSEAAEVAAL